MMAAYRKFAQWYDSFMSDIPYGEWAEYIIDRLKKHGVVPDMVHDNEHSGSCINNKNTQMMSFLSLAAVPEAWQGICAWKVTMLWESTFHPI